MKTWLFELWHFRELLWALTLREIKVRYKQTLLGASWAILQPAALAVIFSIIFGFFLRVESGDIPFLVFYYSSLLPWTFFSNAVSAGAFSVVNNSSLVTKVYFPREILPLASIGSAFFDLVAAAVVFVFLIVFYKISFTYSLLFLLIIVPAILIFATGISLILSAVNVIYRDVRFVIPLILQIWLFASPIIYSIDKIPDQIRKIYIFNPLAPLINSFREVTIVGKNPNFYELGLAIFMSILIFIVGYLFFKKKEKLFADVI